MRHVLCTIFVLCMAGAVSAEPPTTPTITEDAFVGNMSTYEQLREGKHGTFALPELGGDVLMATAKQIMSKEGKKLHKASPLLYDLLEGVDRDYAYTRHRHSSLMEECGKTTFLSHRTETHGYFYGKNGCFGRIQSYQFGSVILDTAFGNVEPDHPESGDTQFITFGIRYLFDQ